MHFAINYISFDQFCDQFDSSSVNAISYCINHQFSPRHIYSNVTKFTRTQHYAFAFRADSMANGGCLRTVAAHLAPSSSTSSLVSAPLSSSGT